MRKKTVKDITTRCMACVLTLAMAICTAPVTGSAKVAYMTGVTEEMCTASYWADMQKNPDKHLADHTAIAALNKDIAAEPKTNMYDLKNMPETIDGIKENENLLKAVNSDIDYYMSSKKYDADGNEITAAYYDGIRENTQNPGAATDQKVGYGICVNRTILRSLPTDKAIKDDSDDDDFDNLYNSALNVNEPFLVRSVSNDGAYYYGYSDCCPGWVPAADIALCKDKTEWLDAWDMAPDNKLVIYGDKVYTEESNNNPSVSKKLLSMGTILKLASESEWTQKDRIINRSAYNNHVVWMPVRKSDGSFDKELALISEHAKASEGYLQLTSRNIASVAFNMLGNAYGWGGMLSSNDCSGYVRDVYKCFGITLARNTSWQAQMPVKKYDVSEYTDEQKQKLLDNLPLGSVLIWSGHEVLYLGEVNGKHYVINSVSSVANGSGESVQRVRAVLVNTIEDAVRGNGNTWLRTFTTFAIPYIGKSDPLYNHDYVAAPDINSTSWSLEGREANELTIPKISFSVAQGAERIINLGASAKSGTIDYYSDNDNILAVDGTVKILKDFTGIATVTVVASGGRYMTAVKNVKIKVYPKKTSVKKVTSKGKTLTVTLKKGVDVSGYEVQYSTAEFTSKSMISKKSKGYKVKIKLPKKSKKYYIRARAYKKVKVSGENVTIYSKWSKVFAK